LFNQNFFSKKRYFEKACYFININNFLLFKKKGLALRNLNRIPEAVKCFEKAIEINRKDYESVDGFYNRNETPPGF